MKDDFDTSNKTEWSVRIKKSFGMHPPNSAHWTDQKAMLTIMTPFMGCDLNHTMLPRTGGVDLEAVAQSAEESCLEFQHGKRTAILFRPATLFWEHFPESPWNSFFLLELRHLKPCGVYMDRLLNYEEDCSGRG